MKLRRSDANREPVASPPEAGGPESFLDRGLLPQWYILGRLGQEMERSRRSGHPFSVVLLSPNSIGAPDPVTVLCAAAAANATARTIDLVGWAGLQEILAILPDADLAEAHAATSRWQSEMWLATTHLGGMKWRSAILDDVASYASPEEALAAVRMRLAE